MDLDTQTELFDQALEELDVNDDLVNQVLEITLDDDGIRIRRYQLPWHSSRCEQEPRWQRSSEGRRAES